MLAIAHGHSDAQQFVPSKNPPEICHVGSLFSGSSLASQHRSKPLGSVQHCSERLMATHTAQNHSVAYSKHFLARCLKTSVRTAQNRRLGTAKHCSGPLKTSMGPLRDHSRITSEPPRGLLTAKHRSGPLKTSSGQLRDHFGTTSGPLRNRLRASGPQNSAQ